MLSATAPVACRAFKLQTSCSSQQKPNLTARHILQRARLIGRSTPALPGVQPRPLKHIAQSSAGGGGGGGGAAGSGGGGGDDGGSGGWEALLLAAGRSLESLPDTLAAAIKEGKVSVEVVKRYLKYDKNPFFRQLMKIGGFRDRLLADESFIVKVAIELGIGLVCKLAAEKEKRRGAFKKEIDFVFANVIMALIADFMLVWLPAPSLQLGGGAAASSNSVSRFFRSCPDNAFQVTPPGVQWSIAQRTGAVARNGAKLLGVGFFASLFGVSITNVLVKARMMLDPEFSAPNPPQNVLVMSGAYASYMASSSNLRYQIIAGVIEERGVERLFSNSPALCAVLSFAIRTGNTFLGSCLWVDYCRLIGVQKKTGEE